MESSTVTRWSPVRWVSFSVRPRVGRISARRPVDRCEWFSLVEIWTLNRVLAKAVL